LQWPRTDTHCIFCGRPIPYEVRRYRLRVAWAALKALGVLWVVWMLLR
jgi:hypothetical protein